MELDVKKEDKNFNKVRMNAEKIYSGIGKVYCPYFKEEVSFNSRGLEHLKFKSKRKIRERKDSYIRLKNIELAPEIIKTSHTLQEKQQKRIFVEIKTNTRNDNILKNCEYYGFLAIITNGNFEKRLKIIVRQVEGGKKHFWSIIPYWKNNKEIKMHSGNMEED